MRVAFTSTDGKAIDEHFGQATHFHVWEVGPDRAEFVHIVGAFGGSGRAQGQALEPGPDRQRAPETERGFAAGSDLERTGGLGGTSSTRPPQQDAGQGRAHGRGPDHVVGPGAGAASDEDDRIKARAEAIEGCKLVYTLQIGGPAAAKLVARHIHPMKTGVELPIQAAVERLQEVLRGSPPPWLRKAMGIAPAGPRPELAGNDEE